MSSTLDREERTLAAEKYEPTLSDQYNNLFHMLVTKMGNTLPSNRAEIIKAEITRVSKDKTQDDICYHLKPGERQSIPRLLLIEKEKLAPI